MNLAEVPTNNRYGQCAIKSHNMVVTRGFDPKVAWKRAAKDLFQTDACRKKGCPREAFLGLCQEGRVKGVRPGNYTDSTKNKEYALLACEKLRQNSNLATSSILLWRTLVGEKAHNGQMDVVLALWREDLIEEFR